MEILVLVMLALLLAIIAIAIVIYIVVRRSNVDKKFGKTINSEFDNFDDDDDEEDEVINIVMPKSFDNNSDIKIENIEDKKKDNIIQNNDVKIDDTLQIMPLVSIREEKKEIFEDVVNVLINTKNYIFLANNNIVNKGDHIKLILDNKVYFGTITKANYQRDINLLKVKPRKLILLENKDKKEEKEVTIKESYMEFMPMKKNKE